MKSYFPMTTATADYGYTNGLVFQPVNDEILNKFSSKRDELTGYKYKKFNIDEFKGLLFLHPQRQRERVHKEQKKKDTASADKKKVRPGKTAV